jgi:DNA end-binding protein Ku
MRRVAAQGRSVESSVMAPRANWKGYLKLSLVSCAVNLYPASSSSSRVSFNTINRKTGNKVKRQFIDPDTGDVVETADQAKGYAVAKNTYLLVEDEELDAVQLESTHTIDIEKFVPRSEIDGRYLDTPYYIAPNERVAEEAFSIIRDAMRDDNVVGLGRVVIARRERIIMLEPLGKGLLGTVLRYSYEVRAEDAYFDEIPAMDLPAEMKDLAHVIIQRKLGHFEPEKFEDRYETAVVELIRSKQAGQPAQAAKPVSQPSNVINIMDALRRSIAVEGGPAPKAAKAAAEAPAPAPKPKAPSKPREAAGTAKAAAAKAPAAAAKVRKAR